MGAILVCVCPEDTALLESDRGGAPASGTLAAPATQTAGTQPLASQLITFTDDSAAWDWQVTCQDALATWVQQSLNPIRTIRVTLTDETNLGPTTVGVGYPSGKDQAAIAYAASPSNRARLATTSTSRSPPRSRMRSATPG
jgi:hypothetical protein